MRTIFAVLVLSIADYLGSKSGSKVSESGMKVMAWVYFIGLALSVLMDIKDCLR